jgi:translation initiation factor IF-3
LAQQNNQQQYRQRVNGNIRVPQVRVILSNGDNGGIMNTIDAIKLAKDENLDLVEINPRALPPVVRIINYGKMKYEEKKKAQDAKKNQQVQELKEITFRPNTDIGDLEHKLVKAKEFLEEGNRTKLTVRFRGREVVHLNVGREKIEWILQRLDGMIAPNPQINMEGKFMSVVVSPTKKQA